MESLANHCSRTITVLVLAISLATGCTSFNDALTPSLEVEKDPFDGSIILRQRPVSAAGSLSEAFHLLGFDWRSRTPDSVFVTAGIVGTHAVSGVQFNVDGRFIRNVKLASATTEFSDGNSYRRFEITVEEFTVIATGKAVKMRLDGINDYTVSSFGPEGSGSMAIINSKFQPFLRQLQEKRSGRF